MGNGTLMTVDKAATMVAMIASGMTDGIEARHARLDALDLSA